MDSSPAHIATRRQWVAGETIFLLGPGGVGKSTLGRELSRQLGWQLIDLDLEFCERIEVIGDFIAAHSYERYRAENLVLAETLATAAAGPTVFVTSSGFLAGKPGSDDHASARRIVATGYGVTLLPSLDVDVATSVVVARQLTRGFGFEQAAEEQKFRQRFRVYRDAGEMLVVSVADPVGVAAAVVDRLIRQARPS